MSHDVCGLLGPVHDKSCTRHDELSWVQSPLKTSGTVYQPLCQLLHCCLWSLLNDWKRVCSTNRTVATVLMYSLSACWLICFMLFHNFFGVVHFPFGRVTPWDMPPPGNDYVNVNPTNSFPYPYCKLLSLLRLSSRGQGEMCKPIFSLLLNLQCCCHSNGNYFQNILTCSHFFLPKCFCLPFWFQIHFFRVIIKQQSISIVSSIILPDFTEFLMLLLMTILGG